MTAVIYARYSSDNQREESIEGQIRECTAYAEKNDITIVKHYIDRAISAKTDNRPQFQQMIKDSDKKLFDIVLVWKLDRFARNRYDSARYKTQLKKNGVKLMSATEIISEGPEGIILESVLEGYAEYYSADLAEKVVRGQTENILKGRCNGGRGTFGYTLDSERKFHIDPLASPFVLESFTKYRDGLTMKEIRDWLNENGIKNPVGGEFTYNSVEHMLKNRRYIGELKFRDVVVPDAIPPIVPLELFDDVQEKIAKNKKAPARRKAEDDYLLTTKLHCGCCGALMFGESGTSRTGEVHRYYKCATAKKKKGCKKKTVRKQWLEDLVVNQTMQLVRDDAAMESIIAKVMELQDRENTNLPLYEKQLRDAESGIQNMLNAIQAGILTSSTKERLEQSEGASHRYDSLAEERDRGTRPLDPPEELPSRSSVSKRNENKISLKYLISAICAFFVIATGLFYLFGEQTKEPKKGINISEVSSNNLTKSINFVNSKSIENFAGKEVKFCGVLKEIRPTRKLTYLNFDHTYPENKVAAVIFDEDAFKFSDITQNIGKEACIEGTVEELNKNKFLIKLRSKEQWKK